MRMLNTESEKGVGMSIIVLCGLPRAGKSYITDRFQTRHGCTIVRKASLCKRAHQENGSPVSEWRQWLDQQYRERGPEVMASLLFESFLAERERYRGKIVIFDSVHNLFEWRLLQREGASLLVLVTAPRVIRTQRRHADVDPLDLRDHRRITYGHEPGALSECLFASCEWSLPGAAQPTTLDHCLEDLYHFAASDAVPSGSF